MPLMGGILGATSGVVIKMWANALAKQRYLAQPWVHVALAGCCGYAGYNLTSWEEQMLVKVNEKRVQKGLVPITRKTLNPISSMISNEE